MQTKHLKSKIISEDNSDFLDRLVHQLDKVKHIAESGFWLSTDEIGVLLNLESIFIDTLDLEVNSQTKSYSFFWRNFECVLVDRQLKKGFWEIRNRKQVLQNTNNHQSPENHLSIQDPKPSTINETITLKIPTDAEIIPSPYALIEDFLSPTQLKELLHYSINKQPEFIPTSNSANDPNYRRSFFLSNFPEFSELMIGLIRKIAPQIITHLDIKKFTIGQIESQMTAHNHGNFYKVHNDNGSPDSATRVLTYVYYYHRQPKSFTGGELVIYDSKIENGYSVSAKSHKVIQPTNNTIVFFPSQCMHEVLPVSCPTEYFADSRFTINGWVRHV
ncbi:MAG: hypothetical protein DCF19_20645 [Pseudanabaena frigida]|uniref:Fe2OG dioxygenase domain-containing protein n=1 Tax=Pseudanabaena frigida TaxID=945775 RepID=A0A2W4W3Y5_9CYAN|nr:MAG: hypothetical protein DCF19_20645 [Pseudanabaena frigida]